MARLLCACLFTLISVELPAQVVFENTSPSLKWYRLESPHFKILYAGGFEAQAQRVANNFETIYLPEARTMGVIPRTVPIVLQSHTATSNGFVTMTPPRSEFFAMPSQDYNFTGTLDMLDMLSAHEFRHVVQFTRARTGFTKWVRYALGPAAFNGMAVAAVPYWFWEGDAVATETAFTRSGRGEIPEFGAILRMNLLESRKISYSKQYLRSYKTFIPNHYVFGYHMVSYLRDRTSDPEIWNKITARAWKVPFIPFAFSSAIHKETGLYVKDLYGEMMKSLKKQWTDELDSLQLTDYARVTARQNHTYTDYAYPNAFDDGGIIVQKSGLDDFVKFVIVTPNNEKTVFVPGLVNPTAMLSAGGGKIAWTELMDDWRWHVQTRSCVKIYDVDKKKLTQISSTVNYAGAALSPDGKLVATVGTDSAYLTHLFVINISTNSVERKFDNPSNDFISMPRWSTDSTLVALKTNKAGRSVALFNSATGSERQVVASSDENIGSPWLEGNELLFSSAVTGIDNVHAINISSGKRYQVTCSKYGAYSPTVSSDGKTIYYNEQTADGLDIASIPYEPQIWSEFTGQGTPQPLAEINTQQEAAGNIFAGIQSTNYPVHRYHKITGTINPYSWGPFFENDLTAVTVGVISRDILSTTSISMGYRYDLYEQTAAWAAQISYQGLFPIFDLDYQFGDRSVDEGLIPVPIGNDQYITRDLRFRWHEQNMIGTMRIPFTATRSKFTESLTLSGSLGLKHVTNFENPFTNDRQVFGYSFDNYVGNGNLLYNRLGLSAYRILKLSPRDINPAWGLGLSMNVANTFPSADYHGGIFSTSTVAYFPGVLNHHSIYARAAYQYMLINNRNDDYFFSNEIFYPRGHSFYRFQNFSSFSVNYTLPLWYPDFALGPVLNIKRIRSNFFYDYGYGEGYVYNTSQNRYYTSTGVELKFDFNVMRFLPQIDMGVRYAYGIHPSEWRIEVLIGTINF